MSQLTFCKDFKLYIDLREAISNSCVDKFSYCALSLINWKNSYNISEGEVNNNLRTCTVLQSHEWNTVIAKLSCGCMDELNSNNNNTNAYYNDDAWREEFEWAIHVGVRYILFPSLTKWPILNYARCASNFASILQNGYGNQELLVPIPLVLSSALSIESEMDWYNNHDSLLLWNKFKCLTNHSNKIACVVDMCVDNVLQYFLPMEDDEPQEGEPEVVEENNPSVDKATLLARRKNNVKIAYHRLIRYMERFQAENIKGIILSTSIFILNQSGYPVLHREYQVILAMLLNYCGFIMIQGIPVGNNTYLHYMQYIQHIHHTKDEIIRQAKIYTTNGFSSSISSDITTPSSASSSTNKRKINEMETSATSIAPAATTARTDTTNASELLFSNIFTSPYKDTLQLPLQPLADNLESCTYETFEKDPIKYRKYEEALVKALITIQQRKMASVQQQNIVPEALRPVEQQEEEISVMETVQIAVVGAGRGPLVACVLRASSLTHIPVMIYAVEKNKHAVTTLLSRKTTEAWENVTIIQADMRTWIPPTGCHTMDIIVSELLGSWGDNELSPECLDPCISQCLRCKSGRNDPRQHDGYDGINIPSSYTSYITPISSSRLWMNARDVVIPHTAHAKGLDTPFVVKLHHCYYLSPTSEPVFHFSHLPEESMDDKKPLLPSCNKRYKCISFTIPMESMNMTLHGFAGTFESVLYEDIILSIKPDTHTPAMFSWFPLYIPLATPILLNKGDIITIHIWRCVDAPRIWYEWCLSSPITTCIQNSNGSSYCIRLY